MATKQKLWKKERTTGRKYSGGDSDTQPAPGERDKVWVSGYARANVDAKNATAHR